MKKFGLVLGLVLVVGALVLPYVGQAASTNSFLNAGDCKPEWGISCVDTAPSLIIADIITILLGLAGLIAVLFVIIGGFQYVMSGANEELAEKGKKTLTNAVIGVIIIVLAFVIVRVIAKVIVEGIY